jgi:Ca-activated chloride channel family protein
LLSWRPALGDRPGAAVFVEEQPEGRFALLMLVPPIPGSEAGLGLPTETLFVIDVSGSMAGPSIEQARRALLASLDRLRPEDRFNIVKFNDSSAPFREEFQQAEGEPLEEARRWVRGLEAGGGTMIYPALMLGLQMMGESRSSRAQRIVFLTDGAVGNEQQLLTALAERLGETRLHTIGIGQAPNSYLMRRMARLGRGLCDFISDGGEASGRVEAFFERLDRPVLADVELQATGLELAEAYPRRLPDLYAGQPLLLSARLPGETTSGSLQLGGFARSGWITASISFDEATPRGRGIALRWARAKVRSLMDSLHEGADPADVRAEVVDLGLAFHMVTAYTSLVAVDDRASAIGNARPVRLASVLPRGGTDGPLRLIAGWVLVLVGLGFLLLLRWGSE